jgi:hypothetical protein
MQLQPDGPWHPTNMTDPTDIRPRVKPPKQQKVTDYVLCSILLSQLFPVLFPQTEEMKANIAAHMAVKKEEGIALGYSGDRMSAHMVEKI